MAETGKDAYWLVLVAVATLMQANGSSLEATLLLSQLADHRGVVLDKGHGTARTMKSPATLASI